MMTISSFTLKGFRVPPGYELVIQTSDSQIIHHAGDQSGGAYTFEEVLNGEIQNWDLHKVGSGKIEVTQELRNIIQAIKDAGGTLLFVGGVVRDKLYGTESKDIDVEVYGLNERDLTHVLSNFGKVDVVGASFGVLKLTTDAQDYDFAFPRRESKQGKGHRGFLVEPDSTMTPKEASSRRDFTINALAMSPDGELFDFFNGAKHLKERILKHTSENFADDPLRVLRGFQLAGRFDLVMDHDTAQLAKDLRREFNTVSKERIWGEWFKWATKSIKPSAGLKVLDDTGWLELFPQLNTLKGIPQDPIWHPEGDVWTHTNYVTDAAVEIADREKLSEKDRTVLIFASLCHDLGKPATVADVNGRWIAPGHPEAGVEPTIAFLTSIGAPKDIIAQVVPLVKEHMAHLNQIGHRSIKRLALRLEPATIELLSLVMDADSSGRPPLPKGMPDKAQELIMMAHQLRVQESVPTPIINGNDLMRLAESGELPPEYARGGPHFGQLLTVLFNAQLDGKFDSPEDGISYLKSIFVDPATSTIYATINFLAGLSTNDKERLIISANKNSLKEADLLSSSVDTLKTLLD